MESQKSSSPTSSSSSSLAVAVKTPQLTTITTKTTSTSTTNTSDDPHEQKLYQMFKSYDVDSKDSLDRESLIKLCKTLEIKDQGAHLVSYFLNTKTFHHRITFDEFKEGLLHYFTDYGMDGNGNCDDLSSDSRPTDDKIINQQSTTTARSLSPSREVSPKFIVGTKKYGRRSRPQSVHTFDSSQSDNDTDDNEYDLPNTSSSDDKTSTNNKVQRSSSHSDIHGTKRRRPIYNTKLKRCASLPAQKPPKNKDDKQLQTQLESSVESLGNLDFENLSQNFYEVWNTFNQNKSRINMNKTTSTQNSSSEVPSTIITTNNNTSSSSSSSPSSSSSASSESSTIKLSDGNNDLTNNQNKSDQGDKNVNDNNNVVVVDGDGNDDDDDDNSTIVNDNHLDYSRNTDSNDSCYLNRSELVQVCAKVGLQKIAHKVADEVFEKLNLKPHCRISFNDFIALINNNNNNNSSSSNNNINNNNINNDSNDIQSLIITNNMNNDNIQRSIQLMKSIDDDDDNNNIINSNTILSNINNCNDGIEQDSGCNINETSISIIHDMHVNLTDKSCCTNKDALITTNAVINMWELAGILNATSILKNLGFGTGGNNKEMYLSELLTILDDELRTVQTDMVTNRSSDNNNNNNTNSLDDGDDIESSTLIKASLVLHKAEVSRLQESYKQLAAQNRKLQDDNKEANRRASLLAQEVDERHASLENSTRSEIHQLERRHNSIVRNLTLQICTDREQLTNLNTKLEAHIKQLEKNELRWKSECDQLKTDNNTLEDEQITLQKQVAELLETNIKLNTDIAVIQDHLDVNQYKDEENIDKDVNELRNQIRLLQLDNSNLRDKNDELSMELEELQIKCTKLNNIIVKSKQISKLIDESADDIDSGGGGGGGGGGGLGNNSLNNQNQNQLATKRRGDSPSKARISEESPRLGKLRKCHNDDDNNNNNSNGHNNNGSCCNSEVESTETSGDWIALNSELSEQRRSPNCSLSKISQESASITATRINELIGSHELHQTIINLENELESANKQDGVDSSRRSSLDSADIKNTIKLQARIKELEQSLDQMRKVYEECEDYWQGKLNEERQLYEEEQRISDEKFKEIVTKMAEYDEQFVTGADRDSGGRLTPIEEKYQLEQQYLEFEAEAEKIKENARQLLEEKTTKIFELQEQIHQLKHRLNDEHPNDRHNDDDDDRNEEDEEDTEEENDNDDNVKRQSRLAKINNPSPPPPTAVSVSKLLDRGQLILNQTSAPNTMTMQMTMNQHHDNNNNNNNSNIISPASSPISYLWNQSTIQAPARDYQNPNWNNRNFTSQHSASGENGFNDSNNNNCDEYHPDRIKQQSISPIQRPISPLIKKNMDSLLIRDSADISDVSSVRSFGTHSVASTHSVHRSLPDAICTSPNEELKKLKLMEMELHDGIKELTIQRDGLVMELQQLQEAKPVLEKAYARTSHPSLNQRIQQLEQKNRHLRNCLVQQQHYTETILHQTWYQQRSEIGELHTRLEAQGILIAEQVQRLTNADILVKDLYVENSQLSAAIQRLEQQRSRNSILLHQGLGSSISGSTSGLSPI